MGQQQLLLLVLGIVIVGLAVVVGIQAFGENQTKANQDALINDAVRIASDAQAWKMKPAAFGGGANATDWAGFDLTLVGYDSTGLAGEPYENLNGSYIIDPSANPLTITGANTVYGNSVTVTVDHTLSGSDAITTTIN